ncbi:MAG: hypothetical protein A2W19_08445 [Spirochaetes bacterium RBG_16_49_21]|nr:MAG: hypothetical protein A2W19_08445 [Spirochaetes bacterium RBG_16_49_21]
MLLEADLFKKTLADNCKEQIMNTKILASFILLAQCALISSCLTHYQTNTWLNTQKGVPTINITGGWDAGSVFGGGWGGASIVQNGNEIIGTIGLYNIKGVINGDNIYLIFTSGAKIYYTGHLKPSQDGSLVGITVENAIVDTNGAQNAMKHPIIMKKYGQIEKK